MNLRYSIAGISGRPSSRSNFAAAFGERNGDNLRLGIIASSDHVLPYLYRSDLASVMSTEDSAVLLHPKQERQVVRERLLPAVSRALTDLGLLHGVTTKDSTRKSTSDVAVIETPRVTVLDAGIDDRGRLPVTINNETFEVAPFALASGLLAVTHTVLEGAQVQDIATVQLGRGERIPFSELG